MTVPRTAAIGIGLILLALFLYSHFFQQNEGSGDVDNPDGDSGSGIDLYADTVGAIVATVGTQTASDAVISYIRQIEGCKLTAYPDVKGYSIGYGHKPASKGQVIDQGTAEDFLNADIASCAASVRKYITVPLSQGQFDALVDFTYNMGAGDLASSTLRKILNGGDYDGVPAQLMRWVNVAGVPNGVVAQRRRQDVAFWNTSASDVAPGSIEDADNEAYFTDPSSADDGSEMDYA